MYIKTVMFNCINIFCDHKYRPLYLKSMISKSIELEILTHDNWLTDTVD